MSEVVKEAYNSKKVVKKNGIFIDPFKNEIKISLSLFPSPILMYFQPDLKISGSIKNELFLGLVSSVMMDLDQEGFDIYTEEYKNFYKFKIRKMSEKGLEELFEIHCKKIRPSTGDYRLQVILPYCELLIKNFHNSENSLNALDLILSQDCVSSSHEFYKKQKSFIIGR
jgi:hypothetical protein